MDEHRDHKADAPGESGDELLPAGRSRETRIRRDDSGRWFNGASRIGHRRIEEAFDRWLDKAENGRYCLKNDINWAYVVIEGPPLFVRQVEVGHEEVRIGLSTGEREVLRPDTLIQDRAGRLYCRAGKNRWLARFDRAAVHQLSSCFEELGTGIAFRHGDRTVTIPVRLDLGDETPQGDSHEH